MFHVELRQFPHNFCRFNLSETELREAILDAWARGEWVELGERKWNPQQAKLRVFEGPRIPLERLSMGRGWHIAEREGKDVTEQLLVAASSLPQSGGESAASRELEGSQATATRGHGRTSASASLAVELLGMLGEDPAPLMRAWQLALEAHPDRTPSECLALAEAFVRG